MYDMCVEKRKEKLVIFLPDGSSIWGKTENSELKMLPRPAASDSIFTENSVAVFRHTDLPAVK